MSQVPISNDEFATLLDAALEIEDDALRLQAMKDAMNLWNGGSMSNALLAAEVSANQYLQRTRDSDISRWSQGTATEVITDPAGQPAPGYYPIRITRSGSTVWFPSIVKMQMDMTKGDPAKTGWIFEVFVKPPANVIMGGVWVPGNITVTNAASGGYCRVAPTGPVVFTILKNGGVIGTATIAAGSTIVVFNLTGGQQSFVKGDRVELRTPTVQDATLAGPSFTFASN